MIQGKWFPTGSDIACPLQIRQSVFGKGQDEQDAWAQQVVVYDHADEPAGSARLYYQGDAFHVDFLGVLPEKRKQGFGDLLVRLCLFKALTHHAARVCMTVPKEQVTFFARYGFTGEQHGDGENVPLSIEAWQIHLDHCGGHCEGCR